MFTRCVVQHLVRFGKSDPTMSSQTCVTQRLGAVPTPDDAAGEAAAAALETTGDIPMKTSAVETHGWYTSRNFEEYLPFYSGHCGVPRVPLQFPY